MKTPERIKLVVSDFHLSSGPYNENGDSNSYEEFFHDKDFEDFLNYYDNHEVYKECAVELVFNGDMLDLLRVSYKQVYPLLITESVSVEKVKKVVQGHPIFFNALRRFLKKPKRKLVWITGNHDQEILWPKVREYLKEALDVEIHFCDLSYLDDQVYIEHGHMYDSYNRLNPKKFFLRRNYPDPVLNIPYGSYFILRSLRIGRVISVHARPFLKWAKWNFIFETYDSIKLMLHTFKMFLEDIFFSKNSFGGLSLVKNLFHYRIFQDFQDVAADLLKDDAFKVVIFGHNHAYRHRTFPKRGDYINTGTWTPVSTLELETLGQGSKLTYACIVYNEGELSAPVPFLREWIGRVLPDRKIRAY